MPINNGGGGGGITIETDPTALKLTGGTMTGDVIWPAVGTGSDSAIGTWGFGVEHDMGQGGEHQSAYVEYNQIGITSLNRSTLIDSASIKMYADYDQVSITANGGGVPIISLSGQKINNNENWASLTLTPGSVGGFAQPNVNGDTGNFNLASEGIYGATNLNTVNSSDWVLNSELVCGEELVGDNHFIVRPSGIDIYGNGAHHLTNIEYSKNDKVADADYRMVKLNATDTNGFIFRHEKNIAPNATTFNEISISATAGVKINGSEIVRADTTVFAKKDGATFTGKVNLGAGTTIAPLNIATGVTPASSLTGDIWISTTNIRYKDSTGTERLVADANRSNSFTSSQTIQVTNNSNPALKITQLGTGEALRVEDETSPDATAFVISNNGRVGIGVTPDATAALCIDGTGIKFPSILLVPDRVVVSTASAVYTRELLVSINGVNYAIPLRLV